MPYGTLSITIAAVLWLLFCYRFWRLVGARHPGQRHLIAAAAGLGAALIYIAGQMMLQAFAAVGQPAAESPGPATEATDVRIVPAPSEKR